MTGFPGYTGPVGPKGAVGHPGSDGSPGRRVSVHGISTVTLSVAISCACPYAVVLLVGGFKLFKTVLFYRASETQSYYFSDRLQRLLQEHKFAYILIYCGLGLALEPASVMAVAIDSRNLPDATHRLTELTFTSIICSTYLKR